LTVIDAALQREIRLEKEGKVRVVIPGGRLTREGLKRPWTGDLEDSQRRRFKSSRKTETKGLQSIKKHPPQPKQKTPQPDN